MFQLYNFLIHIITHYLLSIFPNKERQKTFLQLLRVNTIRNTIARLGIAHWIDTLGYP